MKRTVSPEARQTLHDILWEYCMKLHPQGGGVVVTPDKLMEMEEKICSWYEAQNTLTDVIQDDGKVGKECPTCKALYVVYEVSLRKPLMRILKHLRTVGFMEPNEINTLFTQENRSHRFPSLRHWGLVQEVDGAWSITDRGRRFVDGEISLPQKIYTFRDEVIPTPEGKDVPGMKYIYEIAPDDFSDPRRHVEESTSAFTSPQSHGVPQN